MRQPAPEVYRDPSKQVEVPYLEGILLVYLFDWRRESSELVVDHMCVVGCVRSMTRAAGVLRGVDKSENGSARRGHGRRVEWRNYVFPGVIV